MALDWQSAVSRIVNRQKPPCNDLLKICRSERLQPYPTPMAILSNLQPSVYIGPDAAHSEARLRGNIYSACELTISER